MVDQEAVARLITASITIAPDLTTDELLATLREKGSHITKLRDEITNPGSRVYLASSSSSVSSSTSPGANDSTIELRVISDWAAFSPSRKAISCTVFKFF
jgi:hypothetical protein